MTEARVPAGAAPPSLADPIGTRTRIARADTERLGALREGVVAGQAQQLRLNLFRDVEYRATLEQSTPTASGYTLSGPLDGVPFGRVVLVVNDGKTYGRVYAPEGNWAIRTVGEMQTVERLAPEPLRCGLETGPRTDRETRIGAEEVDRVQIGRGWEERGDHGAMTPETRGLARFETRPRVRRERGPRPGGESPCRRHARRRWALAPARAMGPPWMSWWSTRPSSRDFEGGYGPMLSLIDLDMATANEAYAASGVELRVELAAAVEVEYDWFLDASLVSHTHFETALGHLANPEDGYLDEIYDLRERYAADMVLLHLGGQITSLVATTQPLPGTTVGIAFAVHDVSTKVLKRVALAIARSGDGTAVAHELGHGMGLHHERSKEEPSFNKPFPYSHGFAYDHAAPIPDKPGETYPVVRFGTIMSRYSDRAYPGFVLAFSNPDLVHPEDPELRLGVPGDEPSSDVDGPADATRHLNEVRAVLANVRVRAEADSCRYEVTGESGDLPAGGGTYRVRVETEPDCAWTARGGEWVSSVSSRAGTGSADIGYTVGTNEGFGRPVEILVAGHVHARTQAGSRSITPVCERSNSIKWDLVKMHPDYRLETEGFGNVVVVTYETSCHELTFDPDFLASIDTLNPNAGDPRYIWRGYKVREVRPGDFDGLTGLSTLRVNGFEELPPDAFAGLAGLRILDLSQELFDDSAKLRSIASGAFRGLPGLRRLQIDGHRLRRLDAGAFEGSTGLVHLRVSGARAGALTLEAGAFEGLDDLRLLDVAGNGMTELPPNLFGGLTELRSLILWRNRLRALPDFDGLSALLLLDLWSNEFEAFPSGAFDGLSGLKELNLSFNRLDDVPAAALSSLAALEALDLGRNRLAALEPGDFRDLSELRWLDLYSNRIARLEPGTFDGLSRLFVLGLDDNGMRDIAPSAFEGLGSLGELYLPYNSLGVLRNGVFDGLDYLYRLSLYRGGVKAFEAGLFEATPRLHEIFADTSAIRRLGFGALVGLGQVAVAHFYANPGSPFTVAPTPVLVGAGNGVRGQPLEIALEIASAAPFGARASIVASGGSVSRDALTVGPGRIRSSGNATVTPDGDGPVTVRIAAEPDLVAGASDWRCEPRIGTSLRACYLGFRLAAGPPLVLYGIEDRSMTRGREAEHVDLAEVFSYFVGTADYTVSTSDDAVAAVRVEDGTLTVTPGAAGTAEVTVTAEGAGGETLTRRFTVTVGVPSIPLFLAASEPGREGVRARPEPLGPGGHGAHHGDRRRRDAPRTGAVAAPAVRRRPVQLHRPAGRQRDEAPAGRRGRRPRGGRLAPGVRERPRHRGAVLRAHRGRLCRPDPRCRPVRGWRAPDRDLQSGEQRAAVESSAGHQPRSRGGGSHGTRDRRRGQCFGRRRAFFDPRRDGPGVRRDATRSRRRGPGRRARRR